MKTISYYGTIGPGCADAAILRKMADEGMTGIRMNLSHGKLTAHEDWIRMIHEAEIPDLLIDLQGPELRIGEVPAGCELAAGQFVMLQKSVKEGDIPAVTVPETVIQAVGIGQELLIDDGKLSLQVADKIGDPAPGHTGEGGLLCQVLRGGRLLSRKSLAVPGMEIPSPTLTGEDHENLKLAVSFGVTGVMLPFVRNRQDILNLKQALREYHAEAVQVFAKIENLAGVAALPSFVSEVDHVVIARGDLGNAMPLWELPGCQKRLEKICLEAGTPFMVVTQMLDSMQERAVPTRAEVSDIYNAVADGAASVMLTGETAAGRYPVEAMRYLVRTAQCACRDMTGRINI